MRLAAIVTAALMLASAGVLSAPGCGPTCSTSERVVTTGSIKRSTELMVFETSPPSGPFLPFEGYTLLHVQHGLGVRPDSVQVFLSFSERPEDPFGGGSSPAAGNQSLFLKQDEKEIAIKNDTCSAMWVRVVATAIPPSATTDAGTDAPTDATDADTDADAGTDAADAD